MDRELTLSLLWEVLFALAMGTVVVVLITRSRRLDVTRERGWKRILTGFSLLLLAGLVDITDHFPALNRFVVLGQTPYQAMLEKLGGFLLGSLLLAAGFYRWVPAIAEGRRRDTLKRQRAESRLDRFFRLSLDLHCIATFDGYFKVVNPAFERILGWSEQELVSRPFLEFVHPEDREATMRELGRLGDGRELLYFENRYLCADGTARWLAWTAHPDPEEGLIYAAAHDVSPLKEQERKLAEARDRAEAANRAKSLFLATMSHELRTPLNSVIGFANVLAKNPHGHLDDRERGLADRIKNNGRHLLDLINDILDLSKIEAGKLELSLQPVDLGALIEEVLAETTSDPERSGVELIAEVPPGLAPVAADRARLKQILINLVGNALKFTAHGAVSVRVLVDPDDNQPRAVEVEDTGPGIAPDQLESIFRPFQQADQSWSRSYEGTGLGLAISRSLCQQMGFALVVDSVVGRGSVFRIDLTEGHGVPSRDSQRVRVLPLKESTAPPARPVAGKVVLVVDDNAEARVLLSESIRELGGSCLEAASGEEALAMAERHAPDLITVDLAMPEMHGLELIARLRGTPATREIPIVVVSILADELGNDAPTGVELLTKPVDPISLEEALSRHLSR